MTDSKNPFRGERYHGLRGSGSERQELDPRGGRSVRHVEGRHPQAGAAGR